MVALDLVRRNSLKPNTIGEHGKKIKAMSLYLSMAPPYSTEQVRRYLAHLYLQSVGQSTADKVRQALDWWHEIHDIPSPCNKSIVRLCNALHRELPKQGNVARRPLEQIEGKHLLTICDSRRKCPGDNWHRNSTILALDLDTGRRIKDILCLRHSDLKWEYHPLRLTLWICDEKKDKFSNGQWSIEYPRGANDGILRLWQFTQLHTDSQNDFIFKSSTNNHHISYDSMLEVLHDLVTTANLPHPETIGWHSCRKTRADEEYLKTDGNLTAVRRVLGHTKNSKSTNRYLSKSAK